MKLFSGLVAIYLFLALIFTPFIYSNNGTKYFYTTAYGIGTAFGGSLLWPSYVFAWEPEIDGDSEQEFISSLSEIVSWRESKSFTIKRVNGVAMLNAIGYCLLEESQINIPIQQLFSGQANDTEELRQAKERVMNRFDGMDFKDILDEGDDCKKSTGL